MKAILALENGEYFIGKPFGAMSSCEGEVVFNTSMTGYQEILTDPSYNGQIVCMTYPEIGNYGVNKEDIESAKIQVHGFIAKNICPYPSNYRNTENVSLDEYLKENDIPGIYGIDTRKLVRILRSSGAMRGIIRSGEFVVEDVLKEVQSVPSIVGADLAKVVTHEESFPWNELPHLLQLTDTASTEPFKVVAFDFGVKYNTLRRLKALGAELTVVPADTSADEVRKLNPDGIYLSNGPGDPSAVTYAIETVKELKEEYPVFGICLGHQILALSLGADTFKLKFGHRGANHPIKNMSTERVEITSQNHGFAVAKDNFPGDVAEITHVNLNDQTVAGLKHKSKPVFSIQYHPEASPGPHDSYYLFEEFAQNARAFKKAKA